MSREAHLRFSESLEGRFPGATHLVICCRTEAQQALVQMRLMVSKLQLTVNESKARVCYLPEEKFDFLGYTFGRWHLLRRSRVSSHGTIQETSAAHLSRDRR